MEKTNVIKIGTKVMYRGSFGRGLLETVKVTDIERNERKGEKYGGKSVKSVPFSEREYCVFVLDNGHWCYGFQIESIFTPSKK